ncbi:YbjN domain-containing protein [Oceanibacterium hippocampi]|uniref:YbjN domain-containing protein n=1 Tax=Oceanibacterium hippocampi TaxID=745714 RepID=A0A1Y5U1W9_9PROT|nr:YbjN domain-containing protein [Oceanibacterium hippocampi]SLN74502.1 hypothetical protein OCH7691_03764 [Oceanibacterium hippocampi]
MSLYLSQEETRSYHPLDLVEQVVASHEWPFDRQGDEELTVGVSGSWCEYHLWFSWREELCALHLSCAFDMKVAKNKRGELCKLLVNCNERMWVGHFDLWGEEGLLMFRHSLPLRGANGPTTEQVVDIVETAITECERFYPAIQFCLWGGHSPEDALAAAMLETVGEA